MIVSNSLSFTTQYRFNNKACTTTQTRLSLASNGGIQNAGVVNALYGVLSRFLKTVNEVHGGVASETKQFSSR